MSTVIGNELLATNLRSDGGMLMSLYPDSEWPNWNVTWAFQLEHIHDSINCCAQHLIHGLIGRVKPTWCLFNYLRSILGEICLGLCLTCIILWQALACDTRVKKGVTMRQVFHEEELEFYVLWGLCLHAHTHTHTVLFFICLWENECGVKES